MSNALLDQNERPSLADDQWSVAQLEKNGKPLLVRYRNERPQGVETAAFPFLLSATWAYQSNEFALPSADEMELMDKFEDALASALETSQTAHLMVILTGNGERDWLWYTTGEAEAMQQVNQALKGHKPYPVQFSVQKDRGWKAYAQFETGNGSTSTAGRAFGIIQQAIAKTVKVFCRQ
jgi:uncharacterized protein DUF695